MLNSSSYSKRVRAALHIFLLLTFALAGASCKRSGVGNTNGTANSNAAADETASTPPFSTKEPERYQATVVITSSGGQGSPLGGLANMLNGQKFVARDADKRRFDVEMMGAKVTLLQLPDGYYMLYGPKKLYAEVKPGEGDALPQNATSDFSPDKLINSATTGARYEKLGTEDVNGRATTKYRVTAKGSTGEAKDVTTESIVWVDEILGMPIKTETTSTGSGANNTKVTTELRDISLDVDPKLFVLPADYKKVELKDIQVQIAAGLLGIDGEEGKSNTNTTSKKKR
jgi:hypothetical protein